MESQPTSSFQPSLERLIAFASSEARKPNLLAAKERYFQMTGEVHQDEKAFELRMASFLEYYLFDWLDPSARKTPAYEFYEEQAKLLDSEEAETLLGFTQTIHGLFEVRKIGAQRIRLRALFSGTDHEVTERRQLAGLAKGDILEARLIPFRNQLFFASGFCYHPRAAGAVIRKEVKHRKADPSRAPEELVWECAKMALKVDRYRQIAVERIYDFEQKIL